VASRRGQQRDHGRLRADREQAERWARDRRDQDSGGGCSDHRSERGRNAVDNSIKHPATISIKVAIAI